MYSLFIDTHQNTNIMIIHNKNVLSCKESITLKQSTVIIPIIKSMFDENNLDISQINEIIVVTGPGSFTGVRLGVTIAKTLAYLLNVTIKPINSLELLATMDDFKNKYYGIRDAKGMYIAKNNNGSLELYYKNFNELGNEDILTDVKIDYNKLINRFDRLNAANPHFVNPTYVKKIEAQK